MAPKVKQIVTTLSDAQPKKAVTRFNSSEDNAPLANVYLSNEALAKLGNPDSIKVTITAA